MNDIGKLIRLSTFAWLLTGAVIAVYVEIVNAGAVDPLATTFSEYVHLGQGARLVGVAMLATGFGALTVAGGVRLSGAVWAARLVAVFGVGLCVLAVFPQEPMDQPLTWHGAIHRYVALAAFAALSLAGLVLGAARRWSIATFAALVVFVGTFLVDARAVSGLAERILLVLELALVVMFARRTAVHRKSGTSTPSLAMQPRATLSFVALTSFPCRDLARQRRTCGRSGCGDRGEPRFGA
ncbi:DUF998 domain-containing protein [Amycolatopsis umgeniensis]|uniref:Lysylphosphatidylglycerol synthetase-like protein (DUF2156 family) n=1 Tax=Amycolatopsis umgeniensis TaxID=336628 RepID=A0A841B7G4_9PSEU|nr:DUF998 domain-containing protein [Amycolatopsis umgeniensis]MBB5854512.1 lysylphosphatidylglycerol synthetase-like protein (DUF2156 family) [Amycolatopsis umgeniensis]